jgi:FlaA1/EpsC-like NDP-sugar epimerase
LTLSLLGTLVVIIIFYIGMFLGGIVVYGTEHEVTTSSDRGVVLDIFLMHKRRILEILIDMVLVCLAYGLSFVIRFDGYVPQDQFRLLAQSMPLLVPLKLLAFAFFDLYRGVWRYVGMRDLIAIFKAVTLGSILSISVVAVIYRATPPPGSLFAIDWMALLLLVAGVRVLIHVIREYLVSLAEVKGRRVVIVGAGDAGELVFREFKNNARLGCVPIGFFDDDPGKVGRKIHGVPVLGDTEAILETVSRLGVDQIVVAIPSARPESLEGIIRICKSTGLPVSVMPPLAEVFQQSMTWEQSKCDPWVPRVDSHDIGKGRTWN